MLDFPGPGGLTVGQIFTSAGKSWQWDGAKWGPAAGGGAPIDSPSFTGDPTAPTPSTGDNDTSIATTAFVKAQAYLTGNQSITLSGDIAGSGTTAIAATLASVNANVGAFQGLTLDAKGRVTAAANQGYQTAAQVTTALAPYAPLAAPVFTGDARAVTPATADNDTSIATTAFVKAQNYLVGNQTITLSGDITGSGTTAIAGTLATVNANVGTFQGLTLDAKGRVTAAANQSYVTGGPYLPLAGGTATGIVTISTTNNNLSLVSPAGGAARVVYQVGANHQWTAGSEAGGTFAIRDESVAQVFLRIGTDGTLSPYSILPIANNVHYCGGFGLSWISVSSYAYANASSAELKDNIEPAPFASEQVAALIPKTFTWKEGADQRTHWGFIAEEVRDVLGADFGGYIPGDDPAQQSIAYHELTAVLWKAVQELQAEVAALKAALPAAPAVSVH